METPTNPIAVEAWLRSLMPSPTLDVLTRDGGNEYPFLFGMATVKLAEANREIARLRELMASLSQDIDKARELLETIR